ncbi:MAG: response regulator [Betaproteobacteria bacterium]|nr:MAG: response regulator [Betaproteobacteria bacterium]
MACALETQELIREAWAAQFREPSSIDALARTILRAAVVGSEDEGWGHVHRSFAFRFAQDMERAMEQVAKAEAIFAALKSTAGLATIRDVRVRQLCSAGDETGARALLEENLKIAPRERDAWQRLYSWYGAFAVADRFSKPNDALRALHRAASVAREIDDPAVMANTLSMLGGKHAESNNFKLALQICKEAFRLAKPLRPQQTWQVAALNLLATLNGINDAPAACELADELTAVDESIFPTIREQSNILYAVAYLISGNLGAAQRALDLSCTVVDQRNHITEWTAAQIEVLVARGDFESAHSLSTRWMNDRGDTAQFVSPADALRIYRASARVCESMGDFEAALAHERAASRYHDSTLGQAATSDRIALEIEFDLDRERAARDDADRKRAESEAERARLDELNHKLDAALQTRTRFLAAASHDLRQPAHALALYAAALEHETSRPALVDLSKRMRATVGSLSNMFDGLLELARLDAGAVQPQPDVFDLQELLSRLCSEYGDRLSRPGLLLKFRRRSSDVFLQSDATLVERILRNLISNAVKYAGNGNILIAIRMRGDGVAIEVRDSGPGISTSEQRHVFDEFFRAASADDRRDGLGLGLSIVERFTRLLGMEISLCSAPGRGSTFSLIVPGAMLGARPLVTVDAGLQRAALESRHIAVIDDDSDARESMALLLRQWGHVCVTGASAAALQTESEQQRFSPDALICDFQLDGRTALDDIAALRRSFGNALPVVVISGSHDAQAAVEARFSDVAFLSKPVRPLRLKSWISSLSSDA